MNILTKAILKTLKLHAGQFRKGKAKLPYFIHPLEVGIKTARYTVDEEVIAAALLHDALENTGISKAQLEDEFGPDVTYMVELLSEDKAIIDWTSRKQHALEKIANHRVLLVLKAIDALCNMRQLLSGLQAEGEAFWEYFKAPKELMLLYYRVILVRSQEALPSELIIDYVAALKDLEHFSVDKLVCLPGKRKT